MTICRNNVRTFWNVQPFSHHIQKGLFLPFRSGQKKCLHFMWISYRSDLCIIIRHTRSVHWYTLAISDSYFNLNLVMCHNCTATYPKGIWTLGGTSFSMNKFHIPVSKPTIQKVFKALPYKDMNVSNKKHYLETLYGNYRKINNKISDN